MSNKPNSSSIADDFKRRLDSHHLNIKLEGLMILYKKLQKYSANDGLNKTMDSTQHELQSQLIQIMAGTRHGRLLANYGMEVGLKLVREGRWSWQDMVNHILQVADDKDPILLECTIVYLFKMLELLIPSDPTMMNPLPPQFQHPLIQIVKNRTKWGPQLILVQFQHFLANNRLTCRFSIMEPFLTWMLLNDRSDCKESFLFFQHLIQSIAAADASEDPGYAEMIVIYSLNIIQQMSTTNVDRRDQLVAYLVDWLSKYIFDDTNLNFNERFLNQLNKLIQLHLMNLACGNHYTNRPISNELTLLLRWMRLTGVRLPDELCLTLAHFLFTSNAIRDQLLILDIFDESTWFDSISSSLLPTLLLPLLSIVEQGVLISLQKRTKALLNRVITRIDLNPNNSKDSFVFNQKTLLLQGDLCNQTHQLILDGPLSQILFSTRLISNLNKLDISQFVNIFNSLKILLIGALTLHPSDTVKLDALNHYLECLATDATCLLPSVSLFVYLLNSHPKPATTPYLLYQAFPALVSTSDPFVLARILKLTEGIVNMKIGFQINSVTSAVGIRMMYALYTNNLKIWPTLRFIITNWIKVRKSNAGRNDRAPAAPNELELAALTTFRELCAAKGGEYGPDLFPLLSSLIQFVPLHPLSLSYALSCVNAIVASDAVEVLAVWKVVISPLIDQLSSMIVHPLIEMEICKFYQQIIRKKEDTESYIILLNDLLQNKLKPLIFPLDNVTVDPLVRNEALGALNQFSSNDIAAILPPTPTELVKGMLDTASDQSSWIPLFGGLIAEEIESMSRSVFKGQSGFADTSSGAAGLERSKKVKEALDDIAESFTATGLINHSPGMKSGIHLANMMLFFKTAPDQINGNRDRLLKVAIAEVTFGDDLLLRLMSFDSWVQFFLIATAASDGLVDVNRVEEAPLDLPWVQTTVASLTDTLAQSSIPSQVANACAALGALCIALKVGGRESLSDAFGTQIMKTLLNKLETLTSNSVESHGDIFYGISTSVAQLTTCVPKDFALITRVVKFLTESMVREGNTPDEWVGYSCGRGLGTVFQTLGTNFIGAQPSEEVGDQSVVLSLLNSIIDTFNKSLAYFERNDVSFLMESGVRLGYNEVSMSVFSLSRLYQIDLECDTILTPSQILQQITFQFESLLDPNAGLVPSLELVHKLTALTMTVPYFAPCLQLLTTDKNHETQLELQLINLLAKVTQFLEAPQWSQLRGYCNLAYGTFLHARVTLKGGANSLAKYYSLMNVYLESLDSNTAISLNSYQRLAFLMGLCSLLGVDPVGYSKVQPFCTSSQCSLNNVKRALAVLQNYSGLVGAQYLDDLRSCRSVVCMASQLIHASSIEPREDSLYRRLLITINSSLQLTSSSLEPRDYSRLSSASSYLRAIFEGLSQLGGTKECFRVNLMLIETLEALQLPLPPVNWFPILASIAPLCKGDDRVTLLKFVTKNFLKSSSMMEFFLNEIDQLAIHLPNYHEGALSLLLGPDGLGTVLKLVGFGKLEDTGSRGGWGAILKLVTVSLRRLESTLIKTVQMMIRKSELYEALATLLTTLTDALQSGIQNEVNQAELERVSESFIQFFKDAFFQLDLASFDPKHDSLLTLIVGLGRFELADIEQMIGSLASETNSSSSSHLGPILYHLNIVSKRQGTKFALNVFSHLLTSPNHDQHLVRWTLKALSEQTSLQLLVSLLNLVILKSSSLPDKAPTVLKALHLLLALFQLNSSPHDFTIDRSTDDLVVISTAIFAIHRRFGDRDGTIRHRLTILLESLQKDTSASNGVRGRCELILKQWQLLLKN